MRPHCSALLTLAGVHLPESTYGLLSESSPAHTLVTCRLDLYFALTMSSAASRRVAMAHIPTLTWDEPIEKILSFCVDGKSSLTVRTLQDAT